MVVAWVLFPVVLLAVCLGCGLLVERVAGWRLPGGLLPSVGLALVIVAATLTTSREATVPLTTAVVVILALAGYASSTSRLRGLRLRPWPLAAGLGVFACCAAPVVLSGNATFLGYFVLNDSATHFLLIDQLMSHSHNISGLLLSSYFSTLQTYLASSYPIGADVALGSIRPLVGQDIAWIFQPYLAVIMALGAVALYELLRGAVRSNFLRATCAFIASQSGLVFAYYLEASVKEIATIWAITVTVVLVLVTVRQRVGLRAVVPLLIVVVAGLDVLDLAIVPWLGPPLAVFVLATAWRSRHSLRGSGGRRLALMTAGAAALVAALAAPLLGSLSTFIYVTTGVLTRQGDLGNLSGPLQGWQILGIWPTGDFRVGPVAHLHLTYVLIGVALASALLGAVWTVRRRAYAPLLLLVGNGIAAAYLLNRASPYAGAKVMMIFSLTAVLIVLLGSVALVEAGRRIEGLVLLVVIAGGVLWTNALAYHGASVAPRGRLAELATIGSRFPGQGPTFFNQADEFAVHFLRTERPFDPAQFSSPVPRAGLAPRPPEQFRSPWDPDELDPSYLQTFRLLVLGRSPRISRPPADYEPVYIGRYYTVWRRSSTPTVLQHVPLGGGLYPAAAPSCKLVLATAALATREHARLAYVVRPHPPTLVPTTATRPPNWGAVAGDPFELIPRAQPGAVTGTVRVGSAGRYRVWLGGSMSQRFEVWVGGHHVGSVAYQLGPPGQFVQVGEVTLSAGAQSVRIVRPASNLTPGDDPLGQLLGPLMLTDSADVPAVAVVDPARARSLCGQTLDWLEIVG
jgi:hypothetical protein